MATEAKARSAGTPASTKKADHDLDRDSHQERPTLSSAAAAIIEN
jgi:hypothetical protein